MFSSFVENRLTYSITGGNIGNAFEVVPDLGQLKVRGNLDYENGPRVSFSVIESPNHLSKKIYL